MATKLDDYSEIYLVKQTDEDIEYKKTAISYYPDFELLRDNYQIYVVNPDEEYRPDKIAYRIWGNERMSWVLNAINKFPHGIKEYATGVSIKYLTSDALMAIGVL